MRRARLRRDILALPHQFTALSPAPKWDGNANRELYMTEDAFARFVTCILKSINFSGHIPLCDYQPNYAQS